MYDPKFSQKQMYDQYGRSRNTTTSKPNPGKQFADSMKAGGGGRNMSGIGAKPPSFGGGQDNNPNRDESENKSTVAKVFEKTVDLFKSFGADEPKDVIVDGKRVYQGPAFRGYDPTTRIGDFGGEYGKKNYFLGMESFPTYPRTDVSPTLPPSTINMFGTNTDNPRLNMFGVERGSFRDPDPLELSVSPEVPSNMDAKTRALSQGIIPTEVDYTIKKGDTLSEIAQDRGTTVQVLQQLNNIPDSMKNKIFAGDTIRVPVKKAKTYKDVDDNLYVSSGEITSDGFYDPEKQYYESFRQGITPTKMLQTTGDDTYVSADYMSELEILARTIEAEAGGESKEGKLAVGAVIANRADSTNYGMDIRGVILRKAQFSPWNAITGYQKGISQAKPMLTEEMKPSKDSYDAAKKILSGDYEDPTGGAVHYLNPKVGKKPKWYGSFKKRGVKKIGRHEFGNADNNKKFDGKDYINTRVLESPRPQSRPPGIMARRGLM